MSLDPRPIAMLPAVMAGLLICGCDDAQDAATESVTDAGADAQPAAGDGSGSGGKGGASGASESGQTQSPVGDKQTVKLRFRAAVADRDFACDQDYAGMGSADTAVTPADFRFYVQDVKLIDETGKEVPVELETRAPWQTPDVALLDFEDMTGRCHGTPETNDYISGTVPKGVYKGVVFTNGVPEELNHLEQSTQPPPLDLTDLYWAWLSGYRFLVAELQQLPPEGRDSQATASADEDAGLALPGLGLLHVGSTACRRDGCSKKNRNRVRLPELDPDAEVIVADIAQVFRDIDLTQDRQCHSGDDFCASMFERVGVSWETGESRQGQSMYRVEAKPSTTEEGR